MKKNNIKKRKSSSKLILTLKILSILTVSFIICTATVFLYLAKKAEHTINQSYEEIDRKRTAKNKITDNVSILFIGVDDSEKRGQGAEHSRSDALILATLNNKEKSVKLVSIPRDSYVYIPYVGYKDKITHAHAFGGTLATVETVEQLFDIPIDYYVRLNFDAFVDIVDALGGIDVEVDLPYAITEMDENDNKSIHLEPGFHHLNGKETLALARTRKHDSDLMRGKRQQDILKAIAQKAASVSSISKYDDVLEALGGNMKTDMTFKTVKGFISYISEGVPQIDSLQLKGSDGRNESTGAYIYLLDEESLMETKQILKSHLGLIPQSTDLSSSEDQIENTYKNTDENTVSKSKLNTVQ